MVYPPDHNSLFISALPSSLYPLWLPSRSASFLRVGCLVIVLRASLENTWLLRRSQHLTPTCRGARGWLRSAFGFWFSVASSPSRTFSSRPHSAVQLL